MLLILACVLLLLILWVVWDMRGETLAKSVEIADQLQMALVECRRLGEILRNQLKRGRHGYPLSRSEGSSTWILKPKPCRPKRPRSKSI